MRATSWCTLRNDPHSITSPAYTYAWCVPGVNKQQEEKQEDYNTQQPCITLHP